MLIKTSSLERKFKNLIPDWSKSIIIKFFVNNSSGKLIKFINPKFNLFGGFFDYSNVNNLEAARIFFGTWESAEIRFAKRFYNNKVIVELGSSVGVTLGVLSKQLSNTRFICVEASPVNFSKLQKLVTQLPSSNIYSIVNLAISYNSELLFFDHASTTGSRITENSTIPSNKKIIHMKLKE